MLNTAYTMESVYQDETVAAAAELSPAEQLRQQWNQQPGFTPFLRQKNTIDQNAELLPYAGVASLPGWISPRLFAIQGLVLVAFIASFLNWYMTRNNGKLQDQIVVLQANVQAEVKRQEGIIGATQAEIKRISGSAKTTFKLHLSEAPLSREEALQELNSSLEDSRRSEQQYKERMAAREKNLRATQSALAIANSGSPIVFSLALVLAAGLFGRSAQKAYSKNKHVRKAGDYYLYSAAAEGLWPNLVFLGFLHFALSGSTYGLSGLFASVGPLFWVVSRDIYKAMQIRPPANEWGLENKLLVRIHNSFLLAFVGMEAAFLGLCYALYVAQKSVS